ncbi:hypothetical protein KL86CLO1_10486 [uncultured Eubacteriales bacterium]|uniref:Uncharacterized protein n=1 Tax=uncultured Eubacteriales bacterium TaxID=172733 RepID=A0A212J4Y1_9FIRM|nr:hypothetical protein KL86CLO1_10486 [uncultured Eubacteriales bacterium]
MKNWMTIGNMHINLDRITGFKWDNENLFLQDESGHIFEIPDETGEWYRALCTIVQVTPSELHYQEVL